MKQSKRKILLITILSILFLFSLGKGIEEKIRYQDKITLTQFAPQTQRQTMGYMLKTDQNKIIMIDGGTIGDSEHVKSILKQNGGIVESWYLTHAHDDHFGVLLDILTDENSGIEIHNICLNLNPEEWYKQNDPERYYNYKIANLFDALERVPEKIHVVQNREEKTIDNLNFKILKVASPEILENAGNNQSVAIKVSNRKKSILFLGDLSEQAEDEFIQQNSDEIDCDVVQMAHHGQAGVTFKTYELIRPEICLWPTPDWLYDNNIGEGYNTANYQTIETRKWMEELGVKKNYVAKDGDLTIQIY